MKLSSFFSGLSAVDEVRVKKPLKESGMLVVWQSNYHKLSLMSLRTGYLTKHHTDNRERVWVFRTNHMINTTDGSNHKPSLIFINQSVGLFSPGYSSALSSEEFLPHPFNF